MVLVDSRLVGRLKQSADTRAASKPPGYPALDFYNPNNLRAFPRPIFSLSFSLISA